MTAFTIVRLLQWFNDTGGREDMSTFGFLGDGPGGGGGVKKKQIQKKSPNNGQ